MLCQRWQVRGTAREERNLYQRLRTSMRSPLALMLEKSKEWGSPQGAMAVTLEEDKATLRQRL